MAAARLQENKRALCYDGLGALVVEQRCCGGLHSDLWTLCRRSRGLRSLLLHDGSEIKLLLSLPIWSWGEQRSIQINCRGFEANGLFPAVLLLTELEGWKLVAIVDLLLHEMFFRKNYVRIKEESK